jgi:hypothetical protein
LNNVIISMTASVLYWLEFLATERRCIVFPVRYELNLYMLCKGKDRLCGLVVRVLGYRSGGPGSIPGTTKKKM